MENNLIRLAIKEFDEKHCDIKFIIIEDDALRRSHIIIMKSELGEEYKCVIPYEYIEIEQINYISMLNEIMEKMYKKIRKGLLENET